MSRTFKVSAVSKSSRAVPDSLCQVLLSVIGRHKVSTSPIASLQSISNPEVVYIDVNPALELSLRELMTVADWEQFGANVSGDGVWIRGKCEGGKGHIVGTEHLCEGTSGFCRVGRGERLTGGLLVEVVG